MTKRFEEAVAEIRKLPAEQEDRVADLLIELTGREEEAPALTPEQVAGVHLALEQVKRGEFASDESVERLFTGRGSAATADTCRQPAYDGSNAVSILICPNRKAFAKYRSSAVTKTALCSSAIAW